VPLHRLYHHDPAAAAVALGSMVFNVSKLL